MKSRTLPAMALAIGLLTGACAQAQDYPAQPIKLVVGYAPGGSVDTFARIVGPKLAQELGQTVIVENAAGAGGTIGVNRVVRARPDGYTILMGIVSDVVIAPLAQPKTVPYTYRNLAPVAALGTSGVGVVANPETGIRSFNDLIRKARQSPGTLTYGATGAASLPGIAMESFKRITNTDITFIPYSSASQIATDVMGGNIDLAVSGLPALLELIDSKRVNAVGVMSHDRDIGNLDIPSAGDTPALNGMDFYFWTGFFAPAGTPAPIVDKLNAAINRVLATPEMEARYKALGAKLNAGMSPAQFGQFVANSHAQWETAVQQAGAVSQ